MLQSTQLVLDPEADSDSPLARECSHQQCSALQCVLLAWSRPAVASADGVDYRLKSGGMTRDYLAKEAQ